MTTKLLIGLGNPDAEYQQTRHNLGFLFLDYAAKQDSADFALDKKIGAWIAKCTLELGGKNSKAVLCKPEAYVNVTGPIAAKLKATHKAKPEDIILVHDDLDIPFGKVKLSFEKDSGGHRGVESVMRALKTKKFFRLRLGTANRAVANAYQEREKTKDELIKKFVLAKFTPSEQTELKKVFKEALELLASPGTQLAQ